MTYQPTDSTTSKSDDVKAAFRGAMRNLAATVTIITTREDKSPHGMAATAVSSLTLDPPSLLACVNRTTSLHGPVTRVKWFCVNLLEQRHHALFQDFIARASADRFGVGTWRDGLHGLPYLDDCVASLFCSVEQHVDYGTHTIFIGHVEVVQTHSLGNPLIYQDGKIGRFEGIIPTPVHRIKVGHIIYQVSDMERSVAFYRDMLGLKIKFRDGDAWAAFDIAGSTLALEQASSADSGPTTRLSLKFAEDLDAFATSLREAGVTVGPISTGRHERTMIVTDPDGNDTTFYAPLG
jgi:flavin reductase